MLFRCGKRHLDELETNRRTHQRSIGVPESHRLVLGRDSEHEAAAGITPHDVMHAPDDLLRVLIACR